MDDLERLTHHIETRINESFSGPVLTEDFASRLTHVIEELKTAREIIKLYEERLGMIERRCRSTFSQTVADDCAFAAREAHQVVLDAQKMKEETHANHPARE